MEKKIHCFGITNTYIVYKQYIVWNNIVLEENTSDMNDIEYFSVNEIVNDMKYDYII